MAVLLLSVLLAAAAALAPTVLRIGRAVVSLPAMIVGGMVAGIGAAVQAAVQEALDAVADSDAVKDRLGEPLALPAAEDVSFSPRPANAAADEADFQFVIRGPRGEAAVSATLRGAENALTISRLVVAPVDGSEPILVRGTPE